MKRVLLIALFPLVARADALTDLRTTLNQLAATTPVHGTYELTSDTRNSDEEHPFAGKATVAFESAEAGLRLTYPKTLLMQATQESRADVDGDRQTPVRSGMGRIRALHLAEMLDAASFLTTELTTATLVEAKPTMYRGKPARVVVLKLNPKVSKGQQKHMKSMDSKMSVWLGDDGVPVGAERTLVFKASFLLMSFENDQKQSWTLVRSGDRLVATRSEDTQKSDGFGQHTTSTVIETLRLE